MDEGELFFLFFFLFRILSPSLVPSYLSFYVGQATSSGIPRQNYGQAPPRKQDTGPAPSVLRPGSNPIRPQYPILQPDPHPFGRLTTPTKILRRCPLPVLKHRLELSRTVQSPPFPSIYFPPRSCDPHIRLASPVLPPLSSLLCSSIADTSLPFPKRPTALISLRCRVSAYTQNRP